MTLAIRNVGQISINVSDLQRSIAFYRDVLDLPYIWETNGMAFFMCGEVRLMLSEPENAEFNHPASVIYYDVEDIHVAYELLQAKGVKFQGPPHEIGKLGNISVWMAFFSDSEGNLLAIQSEVTTPGSSA